MEKDQYFNNMIDKIEQACEKFLLNNRLPSKEQLEQGYILFSQKFGPDVLNNLDGELLLDTIFNIGNRNGLTYWLEFKNDDEFRTYDYGSIAGGSAYKYVMFKRSHDDKWVTGSSQNQKILSLDEAVSLARELRDNLVYGADLIRQLSNSDMSLDEFKKLQKNFNANMKYNMNSLGWVHKYYHMIFPNVIDTFHSAKWQRHGLICCGIIPPKEDNLYEMAGHYKLIAEKCDMPISYITYAISEIFGPPVNYFRIGTGEGGKYWHDMMSKSYVAIGWPNLGDLSLYGDNSNTRHEIQDTLVNLYNYNYSLAIVKSGEIVRFYKGINTGDIVMAAAGEKIYGIGKVTGNYKYVKDRDYPHCRSVQWLKIFDEPVKLPKSNEGILTSCFQYKDISNIMAINRLLNTSDNKEDKENTENKEMLPPLTGVMAEIEDVLERKMQVILYGPPGTGKTYYAEKACCELASRDIFSKSFGALTDNERKTITGDGRTNGVVRMCCFHPSYGYEDFIEGIRPRLYNNQTVFELKDGIFKKICKDAMEKPDTNFYLIIDEINRGDISRIFGELIMLIEKGKRGKNIILPLSGETFTVPKNVYIVGTMNTADRSIALLDVALRRRFGFIEFMPDYTLLEGAEISGLPLDGWLKELNARILDNLGKDARNLQIGHSYFLEGGKPITESEKFKHIIKEDIIPLIEEYCYGDYSVISRILGDGIVDIKNQIIKSELFNTTDISNLIAALLSPSPTLRIGTQTPEEDSVNADDMEQTDADGYDSDGDET